MCFAQREQEILKGDSGEHARELIGLLDSMCDHRDGNASASRSELLRLKCRLDIAVEEGEQFRKSSRGAL